MTTDRNPADAADARFCALAASVEDAVVIVDDENVVRFANPAADRLFEASLNRMAFVLPLRAMAPGPVALPLPSGGLLRAAATIVPTMWDGAPGWMATFRPQASLLSDIGPMVDDALTVMRGRFLSHVSHELRTPLNSIVGFAELLALAPHGPLGRDAEADERYRAYADGIRWSGGRLTALVTDLLDLASAESGELRLEESVFELAPLLAEVLREAPLAARTTDAPRVLGTIAPMTVSGDRARLKRALVHLVVNGLSFGGGAVTLSATGTRDGRIRIGIADKGLGFPADAMARASEPFARAHRVHQADPHASAGVGLAVARHMFELHGGGIRVSSRAGRGATVTCTLPSARVMRAESASLRH